MKCLRRFFRRHRRIKRILLSELPLEIVERILSFASTSTLAAACLSSFALLQLASPLLYREICIRMVRLHELFCSRLSRTFGTHFPRVKGRKEHETAEVDLVLLSLPVSQPTIGTSPRILPYLALEQVKTLEIQHLGERPWYQDDKPKVSDRFLDPSSPLPIPRLLLTRRPFPSRYYKPGRGSITFPLLSPSTLIVQQDLYLGTLGTPREIAVDDPLALPLDRLKEVVLVGCIPDVTALPEWDQCCTGNLRMLDSVEGLRVVVDLTELELEDRGTTEGALRGMADFRGDLMRLGDRVEVWMRDEEEKFAMEETLRRLGWAKRLNDGKLRVKAVEEPPVWGLAFS